MFKLLPKLKPILESTVVTRYFYIALILFLSGITLRHEEEPRGETDGCEVSNRQSVLPQQNILVVTVAVVVLVQLHCNQFQQVLHEDISHFTWRQAVCPY